MPEVEETSRTIWMSAQVLTAFWNGEYWEFGLNRLRSFTKSGRVRWYGDKEPQYWAEIAPPPDSVEIYEYE